MSTQTQVPPASSSGSFAAADLSGPLSSPGQDPQHGWLLASVAHGGALSRRRSAVAIASRAGPGSRFAGRRAALLSSPCGLHGRPRAASADQRRRRSTARGAPRPWPRASSRSASRLSLLLALRSQVGGDQLNLLARGWLLVARGEWVPYGNPSSSGGAVPGGMTALLVAAPLLALAAPPRRRCSACCSPRCSPSCCSTAGCARRWRGASGCCSPSSTGSTPGGCCSRASCGTPATCCWSAPSTAGPAWRQRAASRVLALRCARRWRSALGFQVHPSVMLLGAARCCCCSTGHLRAALERRRRRRGLAAVAAGALGRSPCAAQPGALPVSQGVPGPRAACCVFPLLRGILYWLRHASLVPRRTRRRASTSRPARRRRWRRAAPLGDLLVEGRRRGRRSCCRCSPTCGSGAGLRRRGWRRCVGVRPGRRAWVTGYARVCFVAALLIYARWRRRR